MPIKRQQYIIPIVVVGIGLLFIVWVYLIPPPKPGPPGIEQAFNPKGDFTLTEENGKIFHLKDCRGKVVLLFFGYTSCPNACPMTLAKLGQTFTLLGSARVNVLTVFVTVDPLRDTPAKLKEYLGYFDANALGLTGTKAQIDAVVSAYHAFYQKVPTKSAMGYLINHTVSVYLIDRQGKVRYLFHQADTPEKMAGIIKDYL